MMISIYEILVLYRVLVTVQHIYCQHSGGVVVFVFGVGRHEEIISIKPGQKL